MAENIRTRRPGRRAWLLSGAALALAALAMVAFAGAGSAAANDKPVVTSPPSIAGSAQEGQELTADHGQWSNNPDHYDYQWQRCNSDGSSCSDISGATDNKYTVGSADVGNRIRVIVVAKSGNDTSDPSTSGLTDVIAAAGSAPSNTAPPSISGPAQDNQTLTASNGNWNGAAPITFSDQWRRCNSNGDDCDDIGGATQQTYRVSSNDVGHRLRVVVKASNNSGSSSATSDATAVVIAAGAGPKNTTAPTIAGTAKDNQVLTASVGAWTGSTPITYTYLWQSCDGNGNACKAIGGATGATYKVSSKDVGHRLRVSVTAKNAVGSSAATSGPTAVVTGAGPAGAIKLPSGVTSIPITSVSLPDRLVISRIEFSPRLIGSRNDRVTARFRVIDSNGYVVRGALVYGIGVPANRVSVPPEATTDQSGWATLTYLPLRGLPLKNGARLSIFVRARKPGGNVLGGVSTRRLVSIGVHPR